MCLCCFQGLVGVAQSEMQGDEATLVEGLLLLLRHGVEARADGLKISCGQRGQQPQFCQGGLQFFDAVSEGPHRFGHGLADLRRRLPLLAGLGLCLVGCLRAACPLLRFERFEFREGSHAGGGILPRERGDCQELLSLPTVVKLMAWLEIGRAGEATRHIPQLPAEDGFKETISTELPAAAPFLEGLVGIGLHLFRASDTWHRNQIGGHGKGIVHATEVVQVANEPLAVVGEIVNLVWIDMCPDHLCMVDTHRSFLLPDGIVPPLQFGVDMSGHVPHVGDPGGRGAAHRG